jgi:hypothetical protein
MARGPVRWWAFIAGGLAVVLFLWLVLDPRTRRKRGFVQPRPQEPLVVRDWVKFPAIVEVDTDQDIYAIGDVHGDYERLLTLLTVSKIIARDPGKPEKVQWSAGKAVLVCTGDLINKGNQSLQVIALFQALESSAKEAGGKVIVTMGNHEAEFLARGGQGRKAEEFIHELTTRDIPVADVAGGRDALGIGHFMRDLPFAARVNDWFFAHAGNTHGRTLQKLKADLQAGVEAQGFQAPVLMDADSLLEARLNPAPWWERPGDKGSDSRDRLTSYASALGAKHFVFGHQPGKIVFSDGSKRRAGQLYQGFDGLLFLIDVGMSRAVGNSAGAMLHIRNGKEPRAVRLSPHDPPVTLWP